MPRKKRSHQQDISESSEGGGEWFVPLLEPVTVNTVLPEPLYLRMAHKALDLGVSHREFIRSAIESALDSAAGQEEKN